MQLKLTCSKCSIEDMTQYVEMHDGLYYLLECRNGHKTNIVLQEERYEILFEMGTMALLDGYTREAVSSLASSLERFYEYIIELLLIYNGVNYEEFDRMWKQVSNQSERQIGAFNAIYLLNFKEAAERFPKKMIEFRNDVIHKGLIPSRDKVIEYGNSVYKYICNILEKIYREDYIYSSLKLIERRRRKLNIDYSVGVVCIVSIPVILRNFVPRLVGEKSFTDVLDAIRDFQVIRGSFSNFR